MKFSLNKSDMAQGVKKLRDNSKTAISQALGIVGLAILEDTVQQEPKPPFETGFLRGAQFMYVFGQLKTVPGAITNNNTPPSTISTQEGYYTVEVGLNTPYAARQHENLKPAGDWNPGTVTRRGTPKDPSGVGGKFLESKLARFKDQYAELFAREVGKRL